MTDRSLEMADGRQWHNQQNSVGGTELSRVERDMRKARAKELTDQTDQMYQSAGLQGVGPDRQSYDYEGLVAAGGTLTPKSTPTTEVDAGGQEVTTQVQSVDLPNRHLAPNARAMGGRDVATGARIDAEIDDPTGAIEAGVNQYRDSETNTVAGSPVKDVAAASRVAFGLMEQGYGFDDFVQTLPGTFTEEQARVAWRAASQVKDVAGIQEFYTTGGAEGVEYNWDRFEKKVHPDELEFIPAWTNAARGVFEYWTGREFTGTDAEAAEWGKGILSMFYYNDMVKADMTYRAMTGPLDFKLALYDLMTIDENVQTTWGHFGRGLLGTMMSPSTYFGVGLGKVGMQIAGAGARNTLMNVLRQSLGAAFTGAAEGAIWSTVDDYAKQMVEVGAGVREAYSPAEGSMAAGFGATLGGAGGAVLGAAGSKEVVSFAKDQVSNARRKFKDLATDPTGSVGPGTGEVRAYNEAMTKLRTKPNTFNKNDAAAVHAATVVPDVQAPVQRPPDAVFQEISAHLKRSPEAGAPANPTIPSKQAGVVSAGPVTFDQWKARNASILSKDEMLRAASWYSDVRDIFVNEFGAEEGEQIMTAWLMSNQNVDPPGALMNALRVLEQERSGATGLRGGLADPAVRAFFAGEPVERGMSSKLFDFVDSALGKRARTFYGDSEVGGAPAVVDIHSARDMGLVDNSMYERLIEEHGQKALDKMGVVQDVLPGYGVSKKFLSDQGKKKMGIQDAIEAAGIKYDPQDKVMWRGREVAKHYIEAVDKGVLERRNKAVTRVQYEWAADQLRQVTDEANRTNYLGKSDWTPAAIQAVGWTAMARRTGSEAFDAMESIARNRRQLSYELDFGEGAPMASSIPELADMPYAQKMQVSQAGLNHISRVAEDIVKPTKNVSFYGPGGWQQFQAPSGQTSVVSTKEAAEDMADIIGYLGQQTQVNISKLNDKTGNRAALEVFAGGLDSDEKIMDFWTRLAEKNPKFATGYYPVKRSDGTPGIRIIRNHNRGTKGYQNDMALIDNSAELQQALSDVADDMGIEEIGHRVVHVDLVERKNDWRKNKDGKGYLTPLEKRYGKERARQLRDLHAPEVESTIKEEIQKVGAPQETEVVPEVMQ